MSEHEKAKERISELEQERELLISATGWPEKAAEGVTPAEYALDLLTLAEREVAGWRERAETVATIEEELEESRERERILREALPDAVALHNALMWARKSLKTHMDWLKYIQAGHATDEELRTVGGEEKQQECIEKYNHLCAVLRRVIDAASLNTAGIQPAALAMSPEQPPTLDEAELQRAAASTMAEGPCLVCGLLGMSKVPGGYLCASHFAEFEASFASIASPEQPEGELSSSAGKNSTTTTSPTAGSSDRENPNG